MTRVDLAARKESLRRRILRLRDQQTPREIEQKSLKIVQSVLRLSEYRDARVIASYVDKGSEVQTSPLIRKALSAGKRVLVPVVRKSSRQLLFSEISDLERELAPGTFGILEPKPEFVRPRELATTDLVFVPGIAWDLDGYRLGWGKGYFDTVLKSLPDRSYSIGLAFDLQLVERVPREELDVPVTMIVTESRVVRCHHD